MTETQSKPAFIKTLAVSATAVLAVFAALVVAGEAGWIDERVARRAVSALLGLLLCVLGNYLPKLTAQPGPDTAHLARADRIAGRMLMATGLVFAVIWIAAPLGMARTFSPLVGLAGVLAAVISWVIAARRAQAGAAGLARSATATAVRLSVSMMIGAIFATFGLFEIDRLWGDQAAQWSAMILVLMIGFIGATPFVRSVVRRG